VENAARPYVFRTTAKSREHYSLFATDSGSKQCSAQQYVGFLPKLTIQNWCATIPEQHDRKRSTRSCRSGKGKPSLDPIRSAFPQSSFCMTTRSSTPQSPNGNRLASLLALLLLVGAIGAVGGSVRLALKLIYDPTAIAWLNNLFPNSSTSSASPETTLQSLPEIRASLRQQGLIPGRIIPLSGTSNAAISAEVLLPVMVNTRCPDNLATLSETCYNLTGLRIYQSRSLKGVLQNQRDRVVNHTRYFSLINQVALVYPTEAFAVAPLMNSRLNIQGSSRPLPLMQISRMQMGAPETGVWLLLTGQQSIGGQTVSYGQIFHYLPEHTHLSLVLQWASSTNQPPTWQEITGGEPPELVLDQSIGLEPNFRIYQVVLNQPNFGPLQLEEISLAQPAINTATHQRIFSLVRSGLWTPAGQWLQSVKQEQLDQGKSWPAAAQAQLDVIQLHARVTQAQANRRWASPGQEVLAKIIDGRWASAIATFQAFPGDRQEILRILQQDTGQIDQRIRAALRINPQRSDVQTWAALLLQAQKGNAAARAWLAQQLQDNPTERAKIVQLLEEL